MPVIVVGADTAHGRAILDGLADDRREVRAFVTDEDVGLTLKESGFKVAIGDVSDDSHIEAASTACFSAVLVTLAAQDGRERSFARTAKEVCSGWARAVEASNVTRVIWVSDAPTPETPSTETAVVSPDDPDLVGKVVALDEAQTISTPPNT
jgi:nucleoside-diphosphate-sugar epimerase